MDFNKNDGPLEEVLTSSKDAKKALKPDYMAQSFCNNLKTSKQSQSPSISKSLSKTRKLRRIPYKHFSKSQNLGGDKENILGLLNTNSPLSYHENGFQDNSGDESKQNQKILGVKSQGDSILTNRDANQSLNIIDNLNNSKKHFFDKDKEHAEKCPPCSLSLNLSGNSELNNEKESDNSDSHEKIDIETDLNEEKQIIPAFSSERSPIRRKKEFEGPDENQGILELYTLQDCYRIIKKEHETAYNKGKANYRIFQIAKMLLSIIPRTPENYDRTADLIYHVTQARIFYKRYQQTQTRICLQKGEEAAREVELTEENADILICLLNLLGDLTIKHDREKSKRYLKKAAQIINRRECRTREEEKAAIENITFKGRLYLYTGKYKKSRRYFQKVRRYYELIREPNGVAYANMKLVELYQKWGKPIPTKKCLIRGFEALKKSPWKNFMLAEALKMTGRVYLSLGQRDKAQECYKISLFIYKKTLPLDSILYTLAKEEFRNNFLQGNQETNVEEFLPVSSKEITQFLKNFDLSFD